MLGGMQRLLRLAPNSPRLTRPAEAVSTTSRKTGRSRCLTGVPALSVPVIGHGSSSIGAVWRPRFRTLLPRCASDSAIHRARLTPSLVAWGLSAGIRPSRRRYRELRYSYSSAQNNE